MDSAKKDVFQALATKSVGFSGREIHKMFLSLQGAVYGTEECLLTMALWEKVNEGLD